jgi:beta-lactam-binding protein with PASTA domain
MLYGHIETLEQRVDHLERLRKLQDEAPGFDAFIPLKYHSRGNRMSEAGECSVEDDLRTIAISRIFLDNIPHIKAYWVSYGRATTEMALMFGADDIDGTIGDTTKIYSMAGGVARPTMGVDELEAMVVSAGFSPVERDSHYNVVERSAERVEELRSEEYVAEEQEVVDADEECAEEHQEVEEIMQKKTNTIAAPKRRRASTKKEGFFRRIMNFYKRYPIISHIILIGIFGVLLLVGVYVGLKRGTRLGTAIEVPNMLGMNVEEARDMAASEDFRIIVRDSVFDVDLPGGTIVDQLPRTSAVRNVTVKPGRKIYVTINAYNRRMVDVPFVAKQTLRQALNQISRSGLGVAKLVYEPDMTSTDYVLRQYVDGKEIMPYSSLRAPIGTGVTLAVSYQQGQEQVYVPRLVGLALQQAKNSLWDSGLNVGKVVYDDSIEDIVSQRKAVVYRQATAIGTSVHRGDEVTLYLSCDERLIDSMNRVATRELRDFEEQRRKALLEPADSLTTDIIL